MTKKDKRNNKEKKAVRFFAAIKRQFIIVASLAKIGFKNLIRRPSRTVLTSGAITIGVVLILFMVSLGLGVNTWLVEQISQQMDLQSVIIMPKQASNSMPGARRIFDSNENAEEDEDQAEVKEAPLLTTETVESLYEIPEVEKVVPVTTITVDKATIQDFKDPMYSPVVSAMEFEEDDDYFAEVLAGSYLPVNEDQNAAIISNSLLRKIGEIDSNPEEWVGRTITLNVPTKIAPTGFFSTTLEAQDVEVMIVGVVDVGFDRNDIMINIDKATSLLATAAEQTPEKYLAETGYLSAIVKVDSAENTEKVADIIEELGFVAQTTEDMIGLINDVLRVVQVALSSFGGVALLVATLGIANTMVMAIYERTREIGIMKAVGASKGTIRMQFLVESSLIGLVGGLVGVGIGYILVPVGNAFLSNYLSQAGIPKSELIRLPVWLSVGSLIFATLIAMLAGILPARKASRLDPIQAIKYE